MAYAFDKDAKDGDTVTLENGVTYKYEEAKDRWVVLSVGEGSGIARRGFAPHLFQMRGGFEITDGKVVGYPENPNGTGKTARDFWDDMEFADYPGVYHISNWDGQTGTEDNDDAQYQPRVVEYFLINAAGAFKENKDDGTWEHAGLHHVKDNISVGDILTVKVHNIRERDWDDRFSSGMSHKLEHRFVVTEVLPVVDEYGDQLGNDGDWQCVKVEKAERDDLYIWRDHIYYTDRDTPLVEVSVLDSAVLGGGGNYVSKTGGDEMQGPLEIDGGRDPDADGIVSTLKVLNVDSGENSDLQLRADGATRVYVGKNQTTLNGNLKFSSDGAKIVSPEDTNVMQINNNGVFYDGNITAERHLVNKEYVDSADQHLQTKIDEIEQEIDIIAPRLEGASYTYANSPAVKAGEMHIGSGTFTAGTDIVFFNDVALDGKTHTWAELNEGDYLEITDTLETRTADNYVMYLVTKAPTGSGLKQIEVALVKGQGAPAAGDVMDAKGFQLGGNDINDLDDRYMRKDAKNLRLYKQDFIDNYNSKDWKTFSPANGTFELAVSGSSGWETNKSLIFRDLYTIFPPSQWEFCPGYVSGLEENTWSGFDYAPQWQMRMDFCPRFDSSAQVLRGYWKGNNPRNTPGKMYLRFECFRRK